MQEEHPVYQIEAIVEAFLSAGAAAGLQDEREVIRGVLLAVMELFQVRCGLFYRAAGSTLAITAPIRIHDAPGGKLKMPTELPATLETFIRNSPVASVTSKDTAFVRNHLRNLPADCAACASLWAAVGEESESHYGTIVLLDDDTRNFGQPDQNILRSFAVYLGRALDRLQVHKELNRKQTSASSPVDRYLEMSGVIGEVARDLINPLTAILGYIDLIKTEPLNERSEHYLHKLKEQTEKTQQLVMTLNAPCYRQPSSAAERHATAAASPVQPAPSPIAMPKPVRRARVASQNDAAADRFRILLIQKNEAVLNFAKSVLAALGGDVLTAFSGTDALHILQTEDVHAVILDDDLDGDWPAEKIFYWICEHRPEIGARILMTVSSHPRKDVHALMEAAGIAHVCKPLQMGELFASTQQLLGLAQPAPARTKLLH